MEYMVQICEQHTYTGACLMYCNYVLLTSSFPDYGVVIMLTPYLVYRSTLWMISVRLIRHISGGPSSG